MCGIAGIIQKDKPIDRNSVNLALQKISHRGPEDEGVWYDNSGRVAMGHRRLAIIDLSPSGHQPMISQDGRYVIVFNGEIYNFKDLKEELLAAGLSFRSQSDTEVLLYSFVVWGKECLNKLNGMFSFAIWDDREKTLFAARDRLGEKPFKYYFDQNRIAFASEIKAVLEIAGTTREVDWQAVDAALSLRYVPSPRTGFVGVHKLPAGHFLTWKSGELKVEKYWTIDGIEPDYAKSAEEWKEELWNLFRDSVKKRLLSDVPLGAFLSGGVDSTSVVAAVTEIDSRPLNTFVISMDGESEDQKYSRLAANFFKTNHHEIQISDINYSQAVSDVALQYDEPFFDQSALPSILISREMKKFVTVVLSGDGSDELFGGYRNFQFIKFLRLYNLMPEAVRKKIIPAVLGAFSKYSLYKAEILSKNFFESYAEYYSVWKNALPRSGMYLTKQDLYSDKVRNVIDTDFIAGQFKEWFGDDRDVVNAAMLADIKGILADGYLTKMDIATMASALEVRPPFLDYRLVELSRRLPSELKIKGRIGKYIWKELLKTKLPVEILNRPKAGFAIPLERIIQNQLRPMVEDVVVNAKSNIYDFYNFGTVEKMWSEHLNGRADYSNHIWSLLILELWMRNYIKNSTS